MTDDERQGADQLADEIRWLRLHQLAGQVIQNFSSPDAPGEVTAREIAEAHRLLDEAAVVFNRIIVRWLRAPVSSSTTTH